MMIVREKFLYSEKKEMKVGSDPDSSLIIIYKGDKGIRLFISSHRKGDADIYLDWKEKKRLAEIIEAAVLRSSNEDRGFCGPLISPQAGDVVDSVVNAIVQVVFVGENIGFAVDLEDVHGVELWVKPNEIQEVVKALR